MHAYIIGTKKKKTVYLVNNEVTPYQFSFDEKSCHCDGHSGQVVLEPMNGLIQPNTKYIGLHCIYVILHFTHTLSV